MDRSASIKNRSHAQLFNNGLTLTFEKRLKILCMRYSTCMQQTRVSSGGVINRISQQHNNDEDRVMVGISVRLGLGLGFALASGLVLGLRLRLGLGLGLGDLGNGHVENGHVPNTFLTMLATCTVYKILLFVSYFQLVGAHIAENEHQAIRL